MVKSTITLSTILLAAIGWHWGDPLSQGRPTHRLKEEKMTLEYTATNGEAVLVIEAEGEVGLNEVVVCDPEGRPLFEMKASEGRNVELQGFVLETRETTRERLFEQFAEGSYDILAKATDGRGVKGGAKLSHDLLRAPVVLYPAMNALVPTKNLRVVWLNDPEAFSYTVVLEQDENDGLTAELPRGSTSFRVPDGCLLPKTETQLEVGAVGPNGNTTLVEVTFVTL